MSRQIVYKCDADGKEIGRNAHITLMLNGGTGTGIAIPNGTDQGSWRTKSLGTNFLHFHNGQCIGRYFAAKMKNAK